MVVVQPYGYTFSIFRNVNLLGKLKQRHPLMPRIEVLPNTGSAPAPGWAYVADTGYDPSKVAINPTGTGKRATRAGVGGAGSEVSAAALQIKSTKRLNLLDSDASSKEVNVPAKKSGGMIWW